MNIKMPEQLTKLISDLKTDGDFTAISKKIKGSNVLRATVRNVIINEEGDASIVTAIHEFYKEKARITQQLTAA